MSMLKVGGDYERGCRVEHALTMCSRLNTGKSIGVGHKIYGADHWRVAKLKSDTAVLLLEAGNSGEEAIMGRDRIGATPTYQRVSRPSLVYRYACFLSTSLPASCSNLRKAFRLPACSNADRTDAAATACLATAHLDCGSRMYWNVPPNAARHKRQGGHKPADGLLGVRRRG